MPTISTRRPNAIDGFITLFSNMFNDSTMFVLVIKVIKIELN